MTESQSLVAVEMVESLLGVTCTYTCRQLPAKLHASVAQLVRASPGKRIVVGSSPT